MKPQIEGKQAAESAGAAAGGEGLELVRELRAAGQLQPAAMVLREVAEVPGKFGVAMAAPVLAMVASIAFSSRARLGSDALFFQILFVLPFLGSQMVRSRMQRMGVRRPPADFAAWVRTFAGDAALVGSQLGLAWVLAQVLALGTGMRVSSWGASTLIFASLTFAYSVCEREVAGRNVFEAMFSGPARAVRELLGLPMAFVRRLTGGRFTDTTGQDLALPYLALVWAGTFFGTFAGFFFSATASKFFGGQGLISNLVAMVPMSIGYQLAVEAWATNYAGVLVEEGGPALPPGAEGAPRLEDAGGAGDPPRLEGEGE